MLPLLLALAQAATPEGAFIVVPGETWLRTAPADDAPGLREREAGPGVLQVVRDEGAWLAVRVPAPAEHCQRTEWSVDPALPLTLYVPATAAMRVLPTRLSLPQLTAEAGTILDGRGQIHNGVFHAQVPPQPVQRWYKTPTRTVPTHLLVLPHALQLPAFDAEVITIATHAGEPSDVHIRSGSSRYHDLAPDQSSVWFQDGCVDRQLILNPPPAVEVRTQPDGSTIRIYRSTAREGVTPALMGSAAAPGPSDPRTRLSTGDYVMDEADRGPEPATLDVWPPRLPDSIDGWDVVDVAPRRASPLPDDLSWSDEPSEPMWRPGVDAWSRLDLPPGQDPTAPWVQPGTTLTWPDGRPAGETSGRWRPAHPVSLDDRACAAITPRSAGTLEAPMVCAPAWSLVYPQSPPRWSTTDVVGLRDGGADGWLDLLGPLELVIDVCAGELRYRDPRATGALTAHVNADGDEVTIGQDEVSDADFAGCVREALEQAGVRSGGVTVRVELQVP